MSSQGVCHPDSTAGPARAGAAAAARTATAAFHQGGGSAEASQQAAVPQWSREAGAASGPGRAYAAGHPCGGAGGWLGTVQRTQQAAYQPTAAAGGLHKPGHVCPLA